MCMTLFTRICPSCNGEISHTTQKARDQADRNKQTCQKCANKNKGENRATDYAGQKFGKLTAIYFTGEYGHIASDGKPKDRMWHFQCECGKECNYPIIYVVKGVYISCGCVKKPRKHKDITGQKFNMLTAIIDTGKSTDGPNKRVIWLFGCDCGNEVEIEATRVVAGNTTSCGCLRAKEYDGEKQLAYQLYLNYQTNELKKYEVDFAISFEEFYELIKRPCFYCGKEPYRTLKARGVELIYNGIDAIDCSKPHKDNYVVACWTCNKMKSNHDYDLFLEHIKLIYENLGSKKNAKN
jgi:hypothetical protein